MELTWICPMPILQAPAVATKTVLILSQPWSKSSPRALELFVRRAWKNGQKEVLFKNYLEKLKITKQILEKEQKFRVSISLPACHLWHPASGKWKVPKHNLVVPNMEPENKYRYCNTKVLKSSVSTIRYLDSWIFQVCIMYHPDTWMPGF